MKAKPAPEEFTYGAAKAVVWQRGDGRWAVSWSVNAKGKSSTFVKREKAQAKARKVVREIVSGLGTREVSVEDSEVLQVLYRVCGSRQPIAVLQELEDAQKAMRGRPLRLAVDHWRATGMSEVEDKDIKVAVNAFLDDCERRRLAPATRRGLRKELKAYYEAHPGAVVGEILQDTLACWIDRHKDGEPPPAPKYHNNRLATWKTFLNWCRGRGWWPKAEKHPGELIPRLRVPKRMPPIWTPETVTAALVTLTANLATYVALGCYAGLRPEEITRLRWEDLDWTLLYIHVRAEVAGKTVVARYVPIEPCLAEWLAGMRQETGLVALANSQEYASAALRKAGIITKWPQDVMRHSYISYRIARGDGAGLVAEQSGNSERVIKKHYKHPLRPEDGAKYFAMPKEARLEDGTPRHVFAPLQGRPRADSPA